MTLTDEQKEKLKEIENKAEFEELKKIYEKRARERAKKKSRSLWDVGKDIWRKI